MGVARFPPYHTIITAGIVFPAPKGNCSSQFVGFQSLSFEKPENVLSTSSTPLPTARHVFESESSLQLGSRIPGWGRCIFQAGITLAAGARCGGADHIGVAPGEHPLLKQALLLNITKQVLLLSIYLGPAPSARDLRHLSASQQALKASVVSFWSVTRKPRLGELVIDIFLHPLCPAVFVLMAKVKTASRKEAVGALQEVGVTWERAQVEDLGCLSARATFPRVSALALPPRAQNPPFLLSVPLRSQTPGP